MGSAVVVGGPGGGSGLSSGGLVVAGGVDGELAEEFAGEGVDDADVEVLGEEQDVGSGVGSADADVAQLAADADGDAAGLVDPVVADPVVGVGVAAAGGEGFGQGRVDGARGGPVWQGAVRASLVVVLGEASEQGVCSAWMLVGWVGCARSQFFMVCWKRSALPQVVGWLGREFFWTTCSRRSSVSRPLRPPRPPEYRVV